MRKRPTHRPSQPARQTLLESLELRRLLSGTFIELSGNLNLGASITWTPAVEASRNLAVGQDGAVWYTANRAVERVTGNVTTAFALPASANAAVIADLAVTADGSALVLLSGSGGSSVLRLSGGQFTHVPAPAGADHIAAGGNAVWVTLGNAAVEQLGSAPIAVAGVDQFTALASDAAGNAWFAATAAGHGLVGKVTPAGAVTTYTLGYVPADLAVAGGDVWVIDAANPTGMNKLSSNPITVRVSAGDAVNSLAAATDGTVWLLSNGELGKWRASSAVASTTNAYLNSVSGALSITGDLLSGLIISMNGNSLGTVRSVTNDNLGSFDSANTTGDSASGDSQLPVQGSTTSQEQSDTASAPATTPSASPLPLVATSRRAAGDLGVFEGEFSITPQPAHLPPRQATIDMSRTQSNAATHKPVMPETAARGVWISAAPPATELPLLASPMPSVAALRETPHWVVSAAATGDASSATAIRVAATSVTSAAIASAEDSAVLPQDENATRWWKLAVSLSTAAGMELGRGGQRYFRL
jgi:hypothetical protein